MRSEPEVLIAHDHAWQTRSRHHSSEGTVSYQRCHCRSWRVLVGPLEVLAAGAIGGAGVP